MVFSISYRDVGVMTSPRFALNYFSEKKINVANSTIITAVESGRWVCGS